MAKKTNKGGNTRRRPSAGKNLIFRPGPLRQLLFIGLALGGIGIGYGAGFLLKKEQPANLPVQAPVAATTPAIITNPPAPESKPPLLPEDSNPAPGEPPRAYEEVEIRATRTAVAGVPDVHLRRLPTNYPGGVQLREWRETIVDRHRGFRLCLWFPEQNLVESPARPGHFLPSASDDRLNPTRSRIPLQQG